MHRAPAANLRLAASAAALSSGRLLRCFPHRKLAAAVAYAATMLSVLSSLANERQDPFLTSSYFEAQAPRIASRPLQPADRLIEEVGYESAIVTDQDFSCNQFSSAPETDIALAGCYDCPSGYDCPCSAYSWQVLPDGLMYRSYQAGPREPRIGTTIIHNSTFVENSQAIWDGTVGGRRGLIRYGSRDRINPEGWQVDIEGAALVRLNLDHERDVDASDFRFGVPVTWGEGKVRYKLAYYHLSSHLGDEFIGRNPGAMRVNYVRDALLLGASYYTNPKLRLYGEIGYAFYTSGGAEPLELQFGAEYSRPGCTGIYGTPFFATNVHLREEIDFSGDWTTQAGWLWRGASGSVLRFGLHYVNGKSTQYQLFDTNEEQIGMGLWYDF